jgi:tetratricopeptide (TPR) repeat protein
MEGAQHVGRKSDIALARTTIATVLFGLGSYQEAEELFQRAAQDLRDIGWSWGRLWGPWTNIAIGRVCLAQGRKPEAREKFHEALVMISPDAHEWRAAHPIALALSGLEEASDHSDEYLSFCRRYREENAWARESRFAQWFLEPAKCSTFTRQVFRSEFAPSGSMDWIWHDPLEDCSFKVVSGLEIQAANGRDLWAINLSAPRLLQPVAGDFAVQTVCDPASEEKPCIGGLLLWRDKENYLRLDRGTRGKDEISFQGCLQNEDMILGRGRLTAERIFLRLERLDGHVNALCSADGEAWFTVGRVEFPGEGPVEVGPHAIGNIDRILYPGAYPEGTAIRFESFDVWG